MENVIRTLELWKCACHHIIDLESKSWVKLANAPMGYAFEKLMNKHNNDLKAQTHKDGPKPTHGGRRRGSSRGKLGTNAITTPQSNSASMPIPPMAPGNSAATSFLRQAATSNRDGMPELDHHSGNPPFPFPDFHPSVYMPSNQSQFTNEETIAPPTRDVPLMSLHLSHINGPFSVSPWFPQGSVHRSRQDFRQETNGGAYTSIYNNNHVPPAIRARGYNNAYGGSRHAQGQGQAQAQAQYWATDHTTRFKRSQPQDPPQDARSTRSFKKPRTEYPTPFVQEAVARAETPDFFSSPLEENDVGALLFPPGVLATGNGLLDSFAVTQEVDLFDDEWNKEIRRSPSHSSESSAEENDSRKEKKEHDPETGEDCEDCRTATNQEDVSNTS
ncbi:hypothetical protein SLS60_008465 [Paraconiothyrium brasiliense]|uniref:Uncharacterized protein n=1 Tax=Paraconiothyrium brasiliense TaxID=300254 RepID=A0ABR3R0P0_9PLEO